MIPHYYMSNAEIKDLSDVKLTEEILKERLKLIDAKTLLTLPIIRPGKGDQIISKTQKEVLSCFMEKQLTISQCLKNT